MAVYTEVSFAQAEAFVRALGRGGLGDLQGIAAGIENTNYFVTTDDGQWVLTLFERLPHEQLPFYLGYMQHLARRGPSRRPTRKGASCTRCAAVRQRC